MTVGAISGASGGVASAPLLWLSGAARSVSDATPVPAWAAVGAYVLLAALAGALYGRVFMRAANDTRGGWLFGIGYGFLIWMVGPVTLVQWLGGRPLATGVAAQGLLVAHLAYGLLLGTTFPAYHRMLKTRLADE